MIKSFTKNWFNFVSRNFIWLVLSVLSGFLIFSTEISWTLLYIIGIEGLALGLSGIATYVYTQHNFIERPEEPLENLGNKIVLSSIFLGVHFLVGAAAYGIYLAAK